MIQPFKSLMLEVSGLRFIANQMNFRSSIGRQWLMQLAFMTDVVLVQQELDNTETMIAWAHKHPSKLQAIKMQLSQLHDITQIVAQLQAPIVLDDVALFEIKRFAIISNQIHTIISPFAFHQTTLHNLSEVLSLLDPNQQQLPHFYIYPEYDEKIATLHRQIATEKETEKLQCLKIELLQAEDEIRKKLSEKLYQYATLLSANVKSLAYLDFLIAKAQLSESLHFSKPKIVSNHIRFTGLFNPAVDEYLQKNGRQFQPIDIELHRSPCLITGANMSGKSITLKTVGLAQYLFQFGFFVPAAHAEMMAVDNIAFCMGDYQSEMCGLSSFAAEILTINKIIQQVKAGENILVLVDELARTTNPEEGKILVDAFVEIMAQHYVISLITTHYGGIKTPCRRLRVKGLKIADLHEQIVPENLNRYMDYTLEECSDTNAPHEALRIAEIFHVDDTFLQLCRQKKTLINEKNS